MCLVPGEIWGQLEVIGEIRGPEGDRLERDQREKQQGREKTGRPGADRTS